MLKHKHSLTFLTLLLCVVFAALLPVMAVAAEVTGFTSFTYANYFTASYTVAGSNGAASASGAIISFNAKGVNASGTCNSTPAQSATTTVTLTAKESVSVTCTPGSGVSMTTPSTPTKNDDNSQTFELIGGQQLIFSVTAQNGTQVNGTVTFHSVEKIASSVPSGCAGYVYGQMSFNYLDEAIEAAKASGGNIIVSSGGTVYHSSVETDENYEDKTFTFTIPSNVTLLIPCDTANTLYTDKPGNAGPDSYTAPTIFRELRLPSGVNIVVDGAISLGGQVGTHMTTGKPVTDYTNGAPSGPLGHINMASGSTITVNNGANLYAWGFITGSGSVAVNSGGTVYEDLQIRDYRGGSGTAGMNENEYRVFPFSQYYVQNIEVPLTLHSGAVEKVCMTVSVGAGIGAIFGGEATVQQAVAAFVGNDTAGGLFRLSNGSLTKKYDGNTDRIIYDVNGNAKIGNLIIDIQIESFGSTKIKSEAYTMHITNNMTLNVNGSSNIAVNQDLAVLPGAVISVAKDATVTIGEGNKVFIYDRDSWSASYVGIKNVLFSPVCYAPGMKYTRKNTDIVDAEVILNGTLDASKGYLYTTTAAGGANIHSTGSGKLITGTPDGTTVTYQVIQSGSDIKEYPEIPVTPAQLLNGDGTTYVATGQNSPNTFTYDSAAGAWYCETHIDADANHTCDVCGFVTECVDNAPEGEPYADHLCDICGEIVTAECLDENTDSVCDICGKNLCAHSGEKTANEEAAATCVSDGHKAYWQCNDCGYYYSDEACTTAIEDRTAWLADVNGGKIASPGHSYSTKVDYAWTDYTACTASRSCTVCTEETDGHTETVNATIKGDVTKAATCAAEGVKTYTATFGVDWAETQYETETLAIDGDAHKWTNACDTVCDYNEAHTRTVTHAWGDASYTWSENDTKCTASHKCSSCPETETETVVANVVTVDPNCTKAGSTTRTATFTASWADKQTKVETIDALGCDWDEGNVTTDPGCTTKGTKTFTCSRCGETKTEDVEALGHAYVDHVAKAPTCTEIGWAAYQTCNRCDYSSYAEEAALGHNYNAVVTDPTCEEDGYTTYTCTRCSHSYVSDKVTAPGHDYEAVVTKPTCEAGGYTTYTCKNCPDSYVADRLEALGHDYNAVVTAPTCTADGFTTHTCANCGDEYTDTPVNALGHSYTTYTSNGNATCETDGTKTANCDNNCGTPDTVTDEGSAKGHSYSNYTENTPATCQNNRTEIASCDHGCGKTDIKTIENSTVDHSYGTYTSNNDAKCEVNGTKSATCIYDGCGKVDTVEDAGTALEHLYTNYVSNGDATCLANGTETAVCDRPGCGTEHTQEDADSALGHSFTNYVSNNNAVCGVDGTKTAKCDRCDETDTVTNEGSALDHSFTNYVSDDNATCLADGTKTAFCDHDCGEKKTVTETGTKLEHVYTTYVSDGNATCVSDGTKTATCDYGCETTKTITDVDSKLGHLFTTYTTQTPATCTAPGSESATCGRDGCDAIYTREIPVLDHTFANYVSNGNATCTADGTKTATCTGCTATDTIRDEGSMLPHSYGDWYVVTSATCTTEGNDRRDCTGNGCEAFETRSTAIIAHSWDNGTYTNPTFEKDGYTTYKCTGCTETKVVTDEGSMLIAVAQIGSKKYLTLDEAIEAAKAIEDPEEEIIIELLAKWNVTEEQTWDLTGITLEIPEVEGNYGLVINDNLTIQGGTIVIKTIYGIGVPVGGSLTIEGGTFRCEGDNDYLIGNWGTLEISGGTFQGQYSCVNNFAGTTVITGGTFSTAEYDCTGEYESEDILGAGGVSVSGGTFSKALDADELAKGYHAIETDGVYPVEAHSHEASVTDPTCEAQGYTTYTCACGDTYTGAETAATGHTMGQWSTSKEATCTEDGEKQRVCANCDHVETDVIAATGHQKTSTVGAIPVTCVSDGYSGDIVCECGVTVQQGEVIPATGHDYDAVVTDPTCVDQGYTTYTCSNCGDTYTGDEIASLGHSWNDATCTAPKTCSTCRTTEGEATGEHVDENSDNVCDNCDESLKAELTGSIRLRSASLDLKGKVCIIYRTSDDLIPTNTEDIAERGVLIYGSAEALATRNPELADQKIPTEWSETDQLYIGSSEGIDARDMDKSQFAIAYMKMVDGTYIFGTRLGVDHSVEYSPMIYCNNKKNDPEVGMLCRALMHYGAAAQVVQYTGVTKLMNEGFAAVPFDEAVLGESVFSVNTAVVNGIKLRSAQMDLKGEISYIINFSVEDSSIADKHLYAEYNLLGETASVSLEPAANGQLQATISGIPAKDLGATLKVKAYYLDENGEKIYGGELVYSGYEYTRRALTNSSYSADVKNLAKTLAMYVYYADVYGN